MHRKALGRGLEALIPGASSVSGAAVADPQRAGIAEIPLAGIEPNPYQPRTTFDEHALRELADSIKASGVLQPVIVRRTERGHQLVAGERRLRAARLAGLAAIPAIVREVDEREMMEMALIENLQREDLNPMEEAAAYQALAEKANLTHDQISERVGKQRSSITNSLRLLALPGEIQEMVSRGTITAGHARALLSLDSRSDQVSAAQYVQSKGFSVRRTEAFIQRRLRRKHTRQRPRTSAYTEWQEKLQQRFATRVHVQAGRRGGKVTFEYYDRDDLERLLEAWGVV